MDDYISRQAAIEALEKSRFPGVPYIDTGIQIALREIKAIPAADVVPVVYGEWERIPYSFVGGYRCSRCGQKTMENFWLYCPNCCAKMDGERKE